MKPMDIETLSMAILPTEILYHIFPYLPTLELIRCRSVCSVWRSVVDAIARCDEFWRRRCVRDHPSVYKQARAKSPDLTWRNLYRSLHLWTKFDEAKETWTDLFSSGTRRISTTYLYQDSLVVHTGHQVVYCDKEISTVKNKARIGQHEVFSENDHVACYLSLSDPEDWSPMTDLNIVPKSKGELQTDLTVTIDDVDQYVIIEKDVYYGKYYTRGNMYTIFVAKWSDNYNSTPVINATRLSDLSYYDNCLHVLLDKSHVYKKVDSGFEHVTDVDNVFGALKYGFQFRLFEDENYELADSMGANFTISRVLYYNKFIFTGTDHGLLHMYDAEEIAQEPKSKPLVEYNIADIFDLDEDVSIRGIDVTERENGHTVYLSTIKKIVKLDLTH